MFRVDSCLAKPFSPEIKVKPGSPRIQPSEMFARGKKLHVFDYHLRYFSFDDDEWSKGEIPANMTERPFKCGGLR